MYVVGTTMWLVVWLRIVRLDPFLFHPHPVQPETRGRLRPKYGRNGFAQSGGTKFSSTRHRGII